MHWLELPIRQLPTESDPLKAALMVPAVLVIGDFLRNSEEARAMRFNHLVALQPHYWHAAGPRCGDTLETGRLIYLMFFAGSRSNKLTHQ